MRLFFLHDVGLPRDSANTVNVAKMCSAFSAGGNDVTLVCPRAPREKCGIGIPEYYDLSHAFPVRHLPYPRIPGGGRLFRALATLDAKMQRADILYARKPFLLGSAIGMDMALVLEAHLSWNEMGPRDKSSFLALAKAANFELLVCISQALADAYCAQFPAISPKVMVAHDGADIHRALPGGAPPRDRVLVGYAGHLYPGKGMEVIGELARMCPWADFLVIGGTEAALLDWKSRTHSLPNIHFAGFVDHKEVSARLAPCEIVLAPYQSEVKISDGKTDVARWMSPLKIFEYMAQGKAIISSDLSVLREVLAHERNALLVSPADLDGWASSLKRLADDADLRSRLGRQARSELESNYTWSIRADRILAGLDRAGRQGA